MREKALVLLPIVALLLLNIAIIETNSTPTTTMYITPGMTPTFTPPTVNVNDIISVYIKVSDATNIKGAAARLSFDNTILEFKDATSYTPNFLGTGASVSFSYDFIIKPPQVDIFGVRTLAGGSSGTGIWARVRFKAIAVGTSAISFVVFQQFTALVHPDLTWFIPDLVDATVIVGPVPPVPWHTELWVTPKHGGKVWPDWPVGYPGDTQRLYARIRNTGTDAVWVTVKYMLTGAATATYWPRLGSDSPATIRGELLPAATFDASGNMIAPGSVEVASPTFVVPASGYYFVKGIVYLSAVGPTGPWTVWDASMGGDGISRDIGTSSFWVKA